MAEAPPLPRMLSAIIERAPQSALQKVISVEEDICSQVEHPGGGCMKLG